ncbi:MAG: hypothetical protein ACKVHP_15010 [Verrucomicrobiales bacterium]
MSNRASRLSDRRQHRTSRRVVRESASLIPHASRVRQRTKLSMRRRRIQQPEEPISEHTIPAAPESIGLPPQRLSQLTGITPSLERRLYGLGQTRFFQMAHWTAQNIEATSDALGLCPSRIHTQRWVEQAKRRG